MTLQPELDFQGSTYSRERDRGRLFAQLQDVFALMKDGRWRTLGNIASATGHPEASVSARLRDLRKEARGGHTVERRYVGGGLYEYRVLVRA